ncbi:Yip1 family protein [Haloterrigena alkaliphila]|uniref:YIP1 family protein n=1 Tax=Haloterrigena alkaliphila TaxID=2816475 RepID=A0A8A2VSL6_9EURY|nr:Yip1 family protein [Haloterrigena alkaliphila]QSX01029.1 YIP1 family protein [Haloterrigena alkaliphila]
MAPRTPLFDPAEYFARTSRATAQNRGIGVFVLFVVLEIAWLSVAIRLLFAQVHDLGPRLEQQIMSAITGIIVITTIVIVIAWLVVAAIMHYGTSGSNGPGTFTDALSVAGWAYAPELVSLVPSALYGWWTVRQLSFNGSDPDRLAAEFDSVASQAGMGIVPILLVLATTVWSVYILTYGIAETHDVPVDRAVTPAVVVGLGSVVLFLIN